MKPWTLISLEQLHGRWAIFFHGCAGCYRFPCMWDCPIEAAVELRSWNVPAKMPEADVYYACHWN